jgi:hypothetical protein
MLPAVPPESFESGWVVGHLAWKEFQTDRTVEPCVFGLVDHTHAATTELFDDAVVRDGLANHRQKLAQS